MTDKKTGVKASLNYWTRKEFEAIPINQEWSDEVRDFTSLVILPTRRLHDSGYRAMEFIACKNGVPITRIAGGSDVIHLDGIGGVGYRKYDGKTMEYFPVNGGWNIDCLRTSGLLQIFTHGYLIAGTPLSSFELFKDPVQPINK